MHWNPSPPLSDTATPPSQPTAEARFAAKLAAKQHAQCESWKHDILTTDPKAKRLLAALAANGCAFDPDRHVRCMPCLPVASGGFGAEFGIVMCQNQVIHKEHMRETLVHELIHAYDHCVFKYNWMNCQHFACTEIRAANLSGDCQFTRELERGHFKIKGQHAECVRRRAILATSYNPECKGAKAEQAVNTVFEACIKDRQPFADDEVGP
ncbi:peptidase M76 [Catenaria anguillulae PL171]|uniref:Mitochondrial inner membrane protease ATP23 n=1 Tax=Catenaria anguillulae PL171 TaxID=765915 RepID=A0A1Y2HQV5_9FUNG|nr:peptidase M76 [Catenaria anguillulae PL171]